ncbi:MAG: hypothetical protein ACTSUE_13980 [Promethearchaeota archaeon]
MVAKDCSLDAEDEDNTPALRSDEIFVIVLAISCPVFLLSLGYLIVVVFCLIKYSSQLILGNKSKKNGTNEEVIVNVIQPSQFVTGERTSYERIDDDDDEKKEDTQ